MKIQLTLLKLLFLSLLFSSATSYATETKVMIRAKAVDAKFIGTSVGGLRAIIEDAETGEILDQGWIRGGTGSTKAIMEEPIKRGQKLTDDKTAGYLSTIDITSPRLVRIKVIGPYAYRQSIQEASVTTWVIPGEDILGDGITLDIPGFIADTWTFVQEGGVVEIYLKASLLCGCPIFRGGLWDPSSYEAKAILMQDGEKVAEVELPFTGPRALFSAKTTIKKSGHYKAIVYIIDKETGNVGVDRTVFEVDLEE